MDIRRDENSEALRAKARAALTRLLKNHKNRPLLLLCSGGSAFELLSGISENVFGPHLTLGVLDERYTSNEHINNYAQLQITDVSKVAMRCGARHIDTRPSANESLERLAQRFENALRGWREHYPSGTILATQGIGPDGHTSGIMPFPEDPRRFYELFERSDVWVRGYDAEKKNHYPLRVTTTITFLKTIDHSIVYCVGENKREALERVYAERGSYAETPARVLRDMKDAILFTDITA